MGKYRGYKNSPNVGLDSSWWGWQYRKITFSEDLDVDVKAVRQLLDEDDSTNEEEAPTC